MVAKYNIMSLAIQLAINYVVLVLTVISLT